ncbi:hypothetical protein Tco_0158488 [Tanacetum coccineum]
MIMRHQCKLLIKLVAPEILRASKDGNEIPMLFSSGSSHRCIVSRFGSSPSALNKNTLLSQNLTRRPLRVCGSHDDENTVYSNISEKDDSINLKSLLEFEKQKALYSSLFHQLDSMDASFLESEFTLAEVKVALWNSSGSKPPGPNQSCNKGMFKGLVLNDDEVNTSLLQYANNALIIGKWSRRNVRNLVTILNCFQDVSGLGLNLAKSVSSVLYMVLMVGSPLIVGMVCYTKKGLWEGITDCLVIDNMGIPFGDSFIKKKTTKIVILVIVRVRDSGEWGFLWDCVSLLSHTLLGIQDLSALFSGLCLYEGTDAMEVERPMSETLFYLRKSILLVWHLALNRLPLFTTLDDKGLDIFHYLGHAIDHSIHDKYVLDVIGGVVLQFPPSRFHKIFQGVCMYILWSLCKRRNKVVNAISETKDEELHVNIFPMAQANSLFGWNGILQRGWFLVNSKIGSKILKRLCFLGQIVRGFSLFYPRSFA